MWARQKLPGTGTSQQLRWRVKGKGCCSPPAHLLRIAELLLQGEVLVKHVGEVVQQRTQRDRQCAEGGKVQGAQGVVGACRHAILGQ